MKFLLDIQKLIFNYLDSSLFWHISIESFILNCFSISVLIVFAESESIFEFVEVSLIFKIVLHPFLYHQSYQTYQPTHVPIHHPSFVYIIILCLQYSRGCIFTNLS